MNRDDEPFDLGATAEPLDEPSERGGLRRWIALAAALLVGVVLGLVVADTRDDAAGYADVRLVSGTIQSVTDHASETAPGTIELSLLNLGDHEIEILGLEPAGMTVAPDEGPGEPVVAPPGEWVTVAQGGLIADCSDTDPDGGPRVRVRDGGGTERVVEASGLPEFGGVSVGWHGSCRPPDLVFPLVDASEMTHGADSLTMELLVSTSGTEPLPVVRFESNTPGLVVTAPDVPFDVSPDAATPVPLRWTVTDCAAALQWVDVVLNYAVGEDGALLEGFHQVSGRARAELVLLVDRVCESGV